MCLVPCVAPPNWKVDTSCDSFQVTSACSFLLLMGVEVCFVKARCLSSSSLFLPPCLCFAFEVLSQISVVLPFVNPLESVQSAAGARSLPVLILCGTVSKLTDGAVSSICSVDSSWEDSAWMEYFSPLSGHQKMHQFIYCFKHMKTTEIGSGFL